MFLLSIRVDKKGSKRDSHGGGLSKNSQKQLLVPPSSGNQRVFSSTRRFINIIVRKYLYRITDLRFIRCNFV